MFKCILIIYNVDNQNTLKHKNMYVCMYVCMYTRPSCIVAEQQLASGIYASMQRRYVAALCDC